MFSKLDNIQHWQKRLKHLELLIVLEYLALFVNNIERLARNLTIGPQRRIRRREKHIIEGLIRAKYWACIIHMPKEVTCPLHSYLYHIRSLPWILPPSHSPCILRPPTCRSWHSLISWHNRGQNALKSLSSVFTNDIFPSWYITRRKVKMPFNRWRLEGP